ncbi:hypothetical protein C6I20_12300 [Aeromicrobium sp. A1-2]|nr:hypothetical protein C6I20_12300 [Aeromicrobium sp. A1-2]
MVLLAAGVMLLGAVLVLDVSVSPTPTTGQATTLQTTTLEIVTRASEPPPPKFTRTIWATTTLNRSEFMLDFCRGPVSVDLGGAWPILVAEHDYCGGLDWMPELEPGDAIALFGDGVESGTYVVREIDHGIRGHSRVRDLPRTDIVLQTCVSPREVVLVGMDLFEPEAQS